MKVKNIQLPELNRNLRYLLPFPYLSFIHSYFVRISGLVVCHILILLTFLGTSQQGHRGMVSFLCLLFFLKYPRVLVHKTDTCYDNTNWRWSVVVNHSCLSAIWWIRSFDELLKHLKSLHYSYTVAFVCSKNHIYILITRVKLILIKI